MVWLSDSLTSYVARAFFPRKPQIRIEFTSRKVGAGDTATRPAPAMLRRPGSGGLAGQFFEDGVAYRLDLAGSGHLDVAPGGGIAAAQA